MRRRILLCALLLSAACGELRSTSGAMFGLFHDLFVGTDRFDLSEGRHGVWGTRVNGPVVWVVPVEGGVVLIDTGFDESGWILSEALDGREVKGVLLTHSHIDHISGAWLFDAPVYIHQDDVPGLEEAGAGSDIWVAMMEVPLGAPPMPAELIEVRDGEVVELGGAEFHNIHLPGHTPGHSAWRYRDLLFFGDALPMRQTEEGELRFNLPPDCSELAARHLRRMRTIAPEEILDGHNGRVYQVEEAIAEALDDYSATLP